MSFDLAIWKRSATAKTAMLANVYAAITGGQTPHPAMAAFDLEGLETALKTEFGDYTKEPEMLDCPIHCERGVSGAGVWLIVQCLHAEAANVTTRVVSIALGRELLVYDPQRQVVWGNKRPPKPGQQADEPPQMA